MIATLLGGAIKALSDSLLSSLFAFIQSEMRDRGLIAQGQAQQHTADLQTSVTEAKDAAQIQESVARDNDAQLDASLEQVRQSATTKR